VTGEDARREDGSASSNAGKGFNAWTGASCSMLEVVAVEDEERDEEYKELEELDVAWLALCPSFCQGNTTVIALIEHKQLVIKTNYFYLNKLYTLFHWL
jgi:hypothetical protein